MDTWWYLDALDEQVVKNGIRESDRGDAHVAADGRPHLRLVYKEVRSEVSDGYEADGLSAPEAK